METKNFKDFDWWPNTNQMYVLRHFIRSSTVFKGFSCRSHPMVVDKNWNNFQNNKKLRFGNAWFHTASVAWHFRYRWLVLVPTLNLGTLLWKMGKLVFIEHGFPFLGMFPICNSTRLDIHSWHRYQLCCAILRRTPKYRIFQNQFLMTPSHGMSVKPMTVVLGKYPA